MAEFYIYTGNGWNYRPLLLTIILLVVSFFVWAGFFKIEQHVRAVGRIIPAGQAKIVQHLEGGIVNEILIQEGQRVEKGDVLLQISNQRALSDLEEKKIALEALRIKLARLQAEYDESEEFSPDVTADNRKISEIIENEKQIFTSRQQEFEGKIDVLREQARQKELKLEDLRAQLGNMRAERKIASDQHAINEKLRRSGAVSESRYLESKSRVSSFDTRIEQIQKNIPITEAEIQEARQKAKSETESHKTEIIEEINKVQLGIQQLEERIKTLADEVERRALLSPTTGVVNKLYINTVGGVIRPGDPLVEIIPLEENLIVEARVSTKDRGLIWIGLPVVVKVTAYDYAVYGGIDGTLEDISADSFTDQNGGQYYRLRISLASNEIGKGQPLYPGMTVEANIISSKKTILHSLLKPFWRVKENALREP